MTPADGKSYTPGPWSFDYLVESMPDGTKTSIPAVVVPRATICEIVYDDPQAWQANARLIAAAPDLLDALKYVAEELSNCGVHDCKGFHCSYCNPAELIERAEAAILKATVSPAVTPATSEVSGPGAGGKS